MYRRVVVLAVGVGLVMSLGVVAAGAQAETETRRFEDTDTFAEYLPCVSDPESAPLEGFEITIDLTGFEHATHNKNGDHFKFRITGTFSAVPVFFADEDEDGQPDVIETPEGHTHAVAGPREGESFTGTFSDTGGGNFSRGMTTLRFNFRVAGTGDEGTEFRAHDLGHVTATGDPFEDPSAIVKVEFFKPQCH